MPTFVYKVRELNGATSSGKMEAGDRQQATRQLRARGLTPITVTEKQGGRGTGIGALGDLMKGWMPNTAPAPSRSLDRHASTPQTVRSGRIKREALGLTLLQRLQELHNSGLPIGDAIRILSQRITEPKLKQLAVELWRDLSEGFTLAEAMRRQPEAFSESVAYVIEAGEATGNLSPVLAKVTVHLEERAAIRKKMLASLAYPAFICSIAVVVVIFFITFLLPQIENILTRMGGEMTLSARILINGSSYAVAWGPVFLIALTIGTLSLIQWRKTEKGRRLSDRWLLKLPLFGSIARLGELYQTGSLISTLLNSGINTTETLQLTEQAIQNRDLRERFHEARTQVNEGVSVATAFRKTAFLPDLAVDILAIGEDTGNLAHSMDEITKGFQSKLSAQLSRMITLVTTGALLVAFSLVGLVAIGIVTSIFQVSRTIAG